MGAGKMPLIRFFKETRARTPANIVAPTTPVGATHVVALFPAHQRLENGQAHGLPPRVLLEDIGISFFLLAKNFFPQARKIIPQARRKKK